MKSLSERFRGLVTDSGNLPLDQIRPALTLEDLQFESRNDVALLSDIQEKFEISLSDEELTSLRTVANIIAGGEQKVSTPKAIA